MGRFCSLLKVLGIKFFGITIVGIFGFLPAFTGPGTFQSKLSFPGTSASSTGKCQSG